MPGELFVHRNVANVVVHSDLNCLSVIQFAVDVLQGAATSSSSATRSCGGVAAALEDRRVGLADNWLRHVQDVRNRHSAWLDGRCPTASASTRCASSTCVEQALNVCQTTVVQDAWQRGQEVVVHGWVYGLHNGLLKDLKMTVSRLDDAGGLRAGDRRRAGALRRAGAPGLRRLMAGWPARRNDERQPTLRVSQARVSQAVEGQAPR